MTMDDWPQIQPRFARIRSEVGLLALRNVIGCSRAQVDKWAKGKCTPTIPIYQDRVRLVVRMHENRVSRARQGDST